MKYNVIYKKGKKELQRQLHHTKPHIPLIGDKWFCNGSSFTVKAVRYVVFSKNRKREDTTDIFIHCREDSSEEKQPPVQYIEEFETN